MNIVMTGVSHKTAPIGIREQFYFKEAEREMLLSELKNDPSVVEAIVLSTCNRTEIYANVIIGNAHELLIKALLKVKHLSLSNNVKKHFYTYSDREAILHFLRVSSGLESIVLGEKQILGQVKAATELSREKGMMSKKFNILAHIAVRAGKKAQHETQIGCGGASVSWAAVTKAEKMLQSIRGKSVLIIGAGKMGVLAAQQLKSKGIGHIYVMNRSKEKADELAGQFGATAVPFWDIKEILNKVDVCITSACAPHYLVERGLLEKVMPLRPRRRLLCIDISIPRNIDPSVSNLPNVSLVTVDDLANVMETNAQRRRGAVREVEGIILRKVEEFYDKVGRMRAVEETGRYVPMVFS